MDGAFPPFNKVKSRQLEGLLTSQPSKPMWGSSSTAWLNPQARGLPGQQIKQAGQAQGREWQLRLLSICLSQMAFTCLRVLPSPLATSDLHLFWESACVCVCSDNNLSTPTGDRGLEGVGTQFLHSPGTLLKGPQRKGGGRSAPDADRGLDQEGGVRAWESGTGRGWRAAPSGCNGGPLGEGRGDRGWGGWGLPSPLAQARCLPSRYFLRSRRWTLFTTPESFSCSSFRSCSWGGGVLGGPAPGLRALLRPPASGSISLPPPPPPPPLGPPQTPAWRRRWGRRRQQRRQQPGEAEKPKRRPRRWPLTQTLKLIGELWRAGRKRKRLRANGRRGPAAHPVVWDGEQLEEAGLGS